jgi:hypothetical protein
MNRKFDPLKETPNHSEMLAKILRDDRPEWALVDREWKRFKYDHKLNNDQIASMFAGKYKSGRSFEKSTAYREMITGIVRLLITSGAL